MDEFSLMGVRLGKPSWRTMDASARFFANRVLRAGLIEVSAFMRVLPGATA
jgi:hypothetical protein